MLRPGDLLVLNDTRVIPARVRGRRPSGGRLEILFVRPLDAPMETPSGRCWCAGPRGRASGCTWPTAEGSGSRRWARDDGASASRSTRRYSPGSSRAARSRCRPTSGGRPGRLSRTASATRRSMRGARAPSQRRPPVFTSRRDLLDACGARGIEIATLTLHVGPGTFMPIRERRPRRPHDGSGALRAPRGDRGARTRRAKAKDAASSPSGRPRYGRSRRRRPPARSVRVRARRASSSAPGTASGWSTASSRIFTFRGRRSSPWWRRSRAGSVCEPPTTRPSSAAIASTATATRCCSRERLPALRAPACAPGWRPPRPAAHRPRPGGDARLHAGGDVRGGAGVAPNAAPRDRRDHRARERLPPEPSPGRGHGAQSGRAARPHGLGRSDPHRQRRLPGHEPRRPRARRRRRHALSARTWTAAPGC